MSDFMSDPVEFFNGEFAFDVSGVLRFFGQLSLDNPPQLAWHSKIVNILRFYVTMFSQGISFPSGFLATHLYQVMPCFSTPNYFSDRF